MFVFDASTLILTAKIALLDPFLGSVSQKVAIPEQVRRECCEGKKTLDGLMIQRAIDSSRIAVATVKDRGAVAKFQADFAMGIGEAEAIALALEASADVLGIDDRLGIQACKLLDIPFTTALAILVRSRERGLIDRAEALERLAALARYGRYRASLIDDARRKLEEGR